MPEVEKPLSATADGMQAGKRKHPPYLIECESAEERAGRIFDCVQADVAGRPDPSSLPLGAETAQTLFVRFVRDHLAPQLRGVGLRGSGNLSHFDWGEMRGSFSFHKSPRNTKALVEFTIDLSARHNATKRAYWYCRIGQVLPELRETWWQLPVGADITSLVDDVLGAIRDYGMVALKAAIEDHDQLLGPLHQWPRHFLDPISDPEYRAPRFDPFFLPAGVEDAFSDLSSPDLDRRATALHSLYLLAREDARLPNALISVLATEPRSNTRALAARMLGFVPGECEPVVQALLAAVTEDEEPDVRVSARYALRLIARPTGHGTRCV